MNCGKVGTMRRRLELLAIAFVFAAIDLSYKLATPADYHHERSRFAALVIAVVILGLVVLVPRVPSHVALIGAAVVAGGALGNLVSLFVWQQGVPDPLVIQGATHGIAFNLADVFAFSGDVVLLSAVVLHGLRRRAQLRERV
jgi:lipoprotein signal peptidase